MDKEKTAATHKECRLYHGKKFGSESARWSSSSCWGN